MTPVDANNHGQGRHLLTGPLVREALFNMSQEPTELLESLNSLRLRLRSVAIAAFHARAGKANGVPRTSTEGVCS